MKEQIGPKAMFNNLKDNLPFWTEKLPEMPDLVYDAVRQVRQLPRQLESQHQHQVAQNIQMQKARMQGHFAVVFTAGAIASFLLEQPHWMSVSAMILGVICWYSSYRLLGTNS